MKRTNNVIKVFIAAMSLFSVVFLSSCSKENLQNKSVQNGSVSNSTVANTPVAVWNFDSSFNESKQHLKGVAHKNATFTSTSAARDGIAAFLSPKNGFVSYNNAGTALPNLTTGLSGDFWVFAYPKEGGAQCIWCIPQVTDLNGDPSFWPDQHVLLDGYNSAQGDSGLIKVMFKLNKNVPYNEEWTQAGGIPKFYHRWSHIQYSYDGGTSQYTLKVNGQTYFDHVVLYNSGDTTTRQPAGNLAPNPSPHGVLIGAFQNQWNAGVFGPPEVWMLPFKGKIDALKIYDKSIF